MTTHNDETRAVFLRAAGLLADAGNLIEDAREALEACGAQEAAPLAQEAREKADALSMLWAEVLSEADEGPDG